MSVAPAICLVAVLVVLICPSVKAADAVDHPFGDNVQFRGNFGRSLFNFKATKKGTVAFMGGSITEMNGYRPMVCENLAKRFPDTKFTFIDAGISSTCSTTGAMRLAAEVLDKGPVDLFFVEFAVNDDQDAAHTRDECIRGLEGIIRHARRVNPDMDIVVTYFVNEGMLKTLQSGQTPLTIEAHEAVARHYEISTINLAKEVAGEITAGKLTWKQYGGVHPAPFGNAICAKMIEELMNRSWWLGPVVADLAVLPKNIAPLSLDPLNYEHGRFIDLSAAKITSGWTLAVPDWKSLPGGKRAPFTAIPTLYATEPGAEATLQFEGTAVGAYIVAGPDAGMAEASIDGGPFQTVDLYHRFSKGLHYPRTVLLGSELKPGPHTLTLRISKETKSAGHAMRIMHFVAN